MLDRPHERGGAFTLRQGMANPTPRAVGLPQGLRGQLATAVFLPAAVAFLFASPLAAESYTFGGSSIEWTGREVIFRNGSTRMAEFPLDFFRDLTNGFTVRVVIMQGVSDAPDTMMVIPPPGYIAVPEMVTVDEFQSDVIVVTMEGLS